MELYIYNSSLDRLGVIDDFISLRWRRKFYESGEFELHASATDTNIELLKINNIIHRLDRKESAIIETIEISSTEDGNEITVVGRFLSSILSQRIITPTISFSGSFENAMRKIVSDNAINNRPIPNLILGDNNNLTDTVIFQVTWKTIKDYLTKLSKSSNIGYRIRFDVVNKKLVFETYTGTDKSVHQNKVPYICFSDDFDNIDSPTYSFDNQLYKNYAYVGGQGEGIDRIIVEVDLTNGKERREMWVDAKDQSQGELTLDDYKAQLVQFGMQKLLENVQSETFEAKISNTPEFQYLVSWDIGDIVSFEKWGIVIDKLVSEVEEVYENGEVSITPTLGSPIPETLDLGDDN